MLLPLNVWHQCFHRITDLNYWKMHYYCFEHEPFNYYFLWNPQQIFPWLVSFTLQWLQISYLWCRNIFQKHNRWIIMLLYMLLCWTAIILNTANTLWENCFSSVFHRVKEIILCHCHKIINIFCIQIISFVICLHSLLLNFIFPSVFLPLDFAFLWWNNSASLLTASLMERDNYISTGLKYVIDTQNAMR